MAETNTASRISAEHEGHSRYPDLRRCVPGTDVGTLRTPGSLASPPGYRNTFIIQHVQAAKLQRLLGIPTLIATQIKIFECDVFLYPVHVGEAAA